MKALGIDQNKVMNAKIAVAASVRTFRSQKPVFIFSHTTSPGDTPIARGAIWIVRSWITTRKAFCASDWEVKAMKPELHLLQAGSQYDDYLDYVREESTRFASLSGLC
jgi:hypothetical protein